MEMDGSDGLLAMIFLVNYLYESFLVNSYEFFLATSFRSKFPVWMLSKPVLLRDVSGT